MISLLIYVSTSLLLIMKYVTFLSYMMNAELIEFIRTQSMLFCIKCKVVQLLLR